MSDVSAYTDLAQRMANDFADIENDILTAYRKESPDYAELCQQLKNIKVENPIITKLLEGNGDIHLTAAEHQSFAEYLKLRFRLESMERQQIYFQGHMDCISYLKRIKAV